MKEKNEIDELVVFLCKGAKKILEEKGKLAPVGFVITKEKKIIPCALPFRNDIEKSAIYLALGVAVRKFSGSRVIMINDVAMRKIDPKDMEEFKKNYTTEQPLTYPESMRQDGIFLQDMNMETGRIEGYFMRYKNLKDAPRCYYDLEHINKNKDSMGGGIPGRITEGYNSPELMSELDVEFEPLSDSTEFPEIQPGIGG